MYMYRIYRVIIKYCNILCCWSISSTDNYFITPKFKKSLDLPLKLFYGPKYKSTVETAAEAFNSKKRKPEKLEAGAAQENIQN